MSRDIQPLAKSSVTHRDSQNLSKINTTFQHHLTMPPQRRALQEISGNIRNTYKLTSDQRIAIITKYNDGYTPKELADEFRVTTKCIHDTIRR